MIFADFGFLACFLTTGYTSGPCASAGGCAAAAQRITGVRGLGFEETWHRTAPSQAFVVSNIRTVEYHFYVNSQLRLFKAQVFQALAHPTRIAVVEALRDGEVSAGRPPLATVCRAGQPLQHLGVLRAKQIVASRKAGNQVYYTLRDPVLIQVLDLLKQYFNAHLSESVALLGAMTADEDRRV